MNLLSGLVVILFGLQFLGVFKWNLFRGSGKAVNGEMGFFSAVVFGVIFSLGWTPVWGHFWVLLWRWPPSKGTWGAVC